MLQPFGPEHFMKEALKEAQKAFDADEVPIGAVVVCNNRIIARGHNQVERLEDATAHAEMIAITAASENLGSKYLTDCQVYVSLEPCPMCAAALRWAKIGVLVYGAPDSKGGFTRHEPSLLWEQTLVDEGYLANESRELLQSFFKIKREKE